MLCLLLSYLGICSHLPIIEGHTELVKKQKEKMLKDELWTFRFTFYLTPDLRDLNS